MCAVITLGVIMSSDGGSRRGYHHGNLRDVLLDLAETALEARGQENLSLRELASAAQVAPSAPYRHFASRDDLLEALAKAGFERLLVRYQDAASAADPVPAVCEAYLSFSRAHPNLFKLMFVSDAISHGAGSPAMQVGLQSFAVFEDVLRGGMPGSSAEDVRLRALTVWAALHGAALLTNEGRLAPLMFDGLSDEALFQSVIDLNATMTPSIAQS